MPKKIKPLNCPFCGKAPNVGPTDPVNEGDSWGYVTCRNPKCDVHPTVQDGAEPVEEERKTADYIALAVARWNKREPVK